MEYNDKGKVTVDKDDQCFDCLYRLQGKCPMLQGLASGYFRFDEDLEFTVNECQLYNPSKLRVVD